MRNVISEGTHLSRGMGSLFLQSVLVSPLHVFLNAFTTIIGLD